MGSGVSAHTEMNATIPIIMLTARDAVTDRVAGLDLGADDYLVKPFAFEELLARIRVCLRRRGAGEQPVLNYADLRLNTDTRARFGAGRGSSLLLPPNTNS